MGKGVKVDRDIINFLVFGADLMTYNFKKIHHYFLLIKGLDWDNVAVAIIITCSGLLRVFPFLCTLFYL